MNERPRRMLAFLEGYILGTNKEDWERLTLHDYFNKIDEVLKNAENK